MLGVFALKWRGSGVNLGKGFVSQEHVHLELEQGILPVSWR